MLEGVIARTSTVEKGQGMVREGGSSEREQAFLQGFAGRYKILRDGKRRISAIHVTGDFIRSAENAGHA